MKIYKKSTKKRLNLYFMNIVIEHKTAQRIFQTEDDNVIERHTCARC